MGRRVVLFLVVVLIVAFSASPGLARQHRDSGAADCSRTSTGAIPLTDLGEGLYKGVQGGLYPGGTNDVPADHQALGLAMAAEIEPLSESGSPDPNGKIVLISLGVSNTRMEFGAFISIAAGLTPTSVVLVNGAQPGKPIDAWASPDDKPWKGADNELRRQGVTASQVQAAWIKMPERIEGADQLEPFPTDAETTRDQLATVIRKAKIRYPNLKVAYLSSRIYGGYDPNFRPSPEPLAYDEGFAVKWVIEDQIGGSPELNTDPARGDVVAPWIAWGPYMWADGTTPRSDGLIWECSDVQADGTHPTSSGEQKVATMLLDHFLSDPTSAPWFSKDGAGISDVELPPDGSGDTTTTMSATTTSVPGATTTLQAPTTIAQPPTTVITTSTVDETVTDAMATTTRPRKGRDRSGNDDSASAGLILGAVVLLLAAGAGVAALVVRGRGDDDDSS